MNYDGWPRERSRWMTLADVVGLAVVIPLGIAIGSVNLAAAGVRAILRRLNSLEDEALADWNMALGGMMPNTTIDKLIEEEDAHAT